VLKNKKTLWFMKVPLDGARMAIFTNCRNEFLPENAAFFLVISQSFVFFLTILLRQKNEKSCTAPSAHV